MPGPMTDHEPLLLTASRTEVPTASMKAPGQCHVQRENRVRQRSKPLREGRFRWCLAQLCTYLPALVRDIELNPVRADMVSHPAACRLSSYRVFRVGLSVVFPWMEREAARGCLEVDTDDGVPGAVQHVVRSFDPCMDCTVHGERITEGRLATPENTPAPPCYAVIFTSVRQPGDAGYGETAARMLELARSQPGFPGFESARQEIGISVSYWSSLEAIRAWKGNAEHRPAQRRAGDWHAAFRARICRVEREYGF